MVAKFISFMSRKGGVGKSTISVLVASSLHFRTKKRILLIDADPQFSIYNQRNRETESQEGLYEIIAFDWGKAHKGDIPIRRFLKLISSVENEYDIIIMDTPGKIEGDEIPITISISDYVIIPLDADDYGLQSASDLLALIPQLVEERMREGGNIKVFGLHNKVDRTIENRFVSAIEGEGGLIMFENKLSYLPARYKRYRSTIQDIHNPPKEYNAFYKEFLRKCEVK